MKEHKSFKVFLIKIFIIAIGVPSAYCSICIYTDIFNVFHPNEIRVTRAEGAKHFLKMKYLVSHPNEYNAVIFGSSRVGKIPTDFLNEHSNFHWYNMTYSEGVPKEHLDDLISLIKNNVRIKHVLIAVDDISWTVNANSHISQLMRKPFSEYERLGFRFYIQYLFHFSPSVFIDVLKGKTQTEHFYGDGSTISENETFLPAKEEKDHVSAAYSLEPNFSVLDDIQAICTFCRKNGIECTIITNPIWKNTYIDACKNGYLDFLESLAEITPYVNFSGLNVITTDGRNYFEGSHYRPNVGLLMLKILIGEEYSEDLKEEQFGIEVTKENIDEVIAKLKQQVLF